MTEAYDGAGRDIEAAYAQYAAMVYRVCFSFMKNGHDTEDMVQETFLRLLRCPMRFDGPEHEKYWLIATASNVCRDELRRKRRTERNVDDFHSLAAPPFEVDGTLEAVMALPDKLKAVVYMHYYEGWTSGEIAKITGRTGGGGSTYITACLEDSYLFICLSAGRVEDPEAPGGWKRVSRSDAHIDELMESIDYSKLNR